ncbi:LysE family translocator [Saccharopolyspora rosea]|uniref:LysE family translocator n=1 Tax=Saccharopolyspora rosea TaxID=524884 RepID=A0ABW3FX33_9PSEU|nr:LysE family translocator [Saccharopolyspora rosea]
MVSVDRLLVFAAVSFVIIAVPGPSVLFVVGRALAHGRGTALRTVVGNALGSYAVVVAVALGVGTVVQESAMAFTAVKFAGAAYLVFLGIKAVRAAPAALSTLPEPEPVRSGARTVREGFVVGLTNPKTFVFFTAVVPQFVDVHAGPVPVQMLLLGLIPAGIALLSDSTWGLFAATARDWVARAPRRMALVQRLGGFSMIGLGLSVAVTGRRE